MDKKIKEQLDRIKSYAQIAAKNVLNIEETKFHPWVAAREHQEDGAASQASVLQA